MSNLDINIPHQLTREDALERIKRLLATLQREQKDTIKNVQEDWKDNQGAFSFTASGFDLSGKITVEDDHVMINSQLPFALSFFKGKIAQVIQEKAADLLK